MRKKHYEAIASIFKSYHDVQLRIDSRDLTSLESDAEYQTWRELAKRQADYFAQDNPKFNRDRFLTACGVIEKTTREQKELKPFCNICGSSVHVHDDECTKCQSTDIGYTD